MQQLTDQFRGGVNSRSRDNKNVGVVLLKKITDNLVFNLVVDCIKQKDYFIKRSFRHRLSKLVRLLTATTNIFPLV